MINLWWVFGAGTFVLLLFAVGFVSTLLVVQRQKLRLQQEKLLVMEKSELALQQDQLKLEALLHRSQLLQEDLKFVSHELFNLQEGERKRISRELHDDVGQLLASISTNLDLAQGMMGTENDQLCKRITESARMTDDVYDRLRRFLTDLRAISPDELGLVPAIKKLAAQTADRTGISIEVIAGENDGTDRFDNEQRVTLYRIAQESLTNAIKHARGVTHITLALVCDPPPKNGSPTNGRRVSLEIHDNGCGFDYPALLASMESISSMTNDCEPMAHESRIGVDGTGSEGLRPQETTGPHRKGGLGLLGMRERVQLLGGEFSVHSEHNKGTSIRVALPVMLEKGIDDPERHLTPSR